MCRLTDHRELPYETESALVERVQVESRVRQSCRGDRVLAHVVGVQWSHEQECRATRLDHDRGGQSFVESLLHHEPREQGARVRQLHASTRLVEIPRPEQPGAAPQGWPARTRGQHFSDASRPELMQTPASEWEPIVSGVGSDDDERLVEFRPVCSLPRGTELARPSRGVRPRAGGNSGFPTHVAGYRHQFSRGQARDGYLSEPDTGLFISGLSIAEWSSRGEQNAGEPSPTFLRSAS